MSEIQGEVLEGRSVCQRLQEETSSPESSAPKELYPLTKLQTIALIESLKRILSRSLEISPRGSAPECTVHEMFTLDCSFELTSDLYDKLLSRLCPYLSTHVFPDPLIKRCTNIWCVLCVVGQ